MKIILSFVMAAFLLCSNHVLAQLAISNGAQFVMTGGVQLTLANTDLVNNGSLLAGTGVISFIGGSPSFIGGSQGSAFYDLQINKSTGGNVVLQHSISIGRQINFTSGLMDLNGFDVDLGSTGSLNGEQGSSHIIGANGGAVILHTTLNAPTSANPGNLGVIITSAQNLGSTVIRRGSQSQTTGSATGSSILRYYDILPANNAALNATLRIRYLDAELNGLDKNSLLVWEKPAAGNWTSLGEDSHDAMNNYVEKTAISSMGLFTLSGPSSALPVNFILFDAHCTGNSVLLNWKTAQEANSHYFSVEKSTDGLQWTVLGNVAAAGNAAVETAYSFADNSPAGNNYYRIAEYDLSGAAQFTRVLRTDCGVGDAFKIWPNPVDDLLYVSMTTVSGGEVVIQLFDGKGALVRSRQAALQPGNNSLNVDVTGIAAGVYYAAVIFKNRQLQMQKVIKK